MFNGFAKGLQLFFYIIYWYPIYFEISLDHDRCHGQSVICIVMSYLITGINLMSGCDDTGVDMYRSLVLHSDTQSGGKGSID